jgi:hypothetical protein
MLNSDLTTDATFRFVLIEVLMQVFVIPTQCLIDTCMSCIRSCENTKGTIYYTASPSNFYR